MLKSFFVTLKTELVHDARWATRGEATEALAAYTGATSLRRLEKTDPGGDITL